jgi:hypothetical protein
MLTKEIGINSRLSRIRSGKSDFFKENPSASIIATKLIPDRRRPNETPRDDGVKLTDDSAFNTMMQTRAKKNMDADTILRLNPDIKLIRETLVSCIRSPLSMEDDELFFKVGDSDLPLSLLNSMVEPITQHFSTDHDLGDELSDMIADALVNRGASIWAIIPEASLDDLINKTSRPSNESWQTTVNSHFFDPKAGILKAVGILGGPENPSQSAQVPSFELYSEEALPNQKIADNLYITDNATQLRLPALNTAFNTVRMRSKLSMHAGIGRIPRVSAEAAPSTESGSTFGMKTGPNPDEERKAMARNIERIQQSLYRPSGSNRNRRSAYGNTQVVRSSHEASRSSIGHPLVIPLLNESTIPVFVPGNPKRHIGYYVITDGFGQPLNVTQELKRFQEHGIASMQGSSMTDQTTAMLQQINVMQNGYCVDKDTGTAERLRIFGEVMEAQLMNRLKNGLRGMSVKIKHDEDIMRLMFMRQLANEMTHIVFLAADQVAYLAYEYDENGVGVSMLDGVKQVATLRTMCNFANFMASIRNAVGRTRVTINIDERDPDPEKSAAILQDEFLRSQAGVSPTDVASSAEMFRVIRQMGIIFDIQGNSRIPNTSVNVEDFQSQKQMIDNDFMDRLEKQVYMGFYVTPEMVDATQSADFAITRWTTNQLFAKRIKNLQKLTERYLAWYVTIYSMSSGTLIHELQSIIEAAKEKIPAQYLERGGDNGSHGVLYDNIIEEFFRVLEVKLPSPDNTKLDTQMDQLNKYVQGLDVALAAWISSDFMDMTTNDNDSNYLNQVIASVKAYYIRQYMLENNIFPELAELTRKGTEDSPALNISKEVMLHLQNLVTNLGDWGAAVKLRRELYLENLEKKNQQYADAIRNGTSGGSSDDTSTDGNSDDDSDDGAFSMDSPPGMDDETPPEETPPENTDDNAPPEEPASPEASAPASDAGDSPAAPSAPSEPSA